MPARADRPVPAPGSEPAPAALRIGAVLSALAADYPDISISKIRFLEAEGLITPERTPAGYRLYSAGDVERLRYILTAQRERFWPLKVIREALDALDRGLVPQGPDGGRPTPPAPAEDPTVPAARDLASTSAVRLTEEELATSTGASPDIITSLQGFGLLHPDSSGLYDETDAQVALAAASLAAYGIEPRHLRPFRTAADREVGLVEQALMSEGNPQRRRERGAEVARHCLALHAALVKGGLTRS